MKGIRVSDVKINNCIFADQRSDTFCTAHVFAMLTAQHTAARLYECCVN